MRKHALIYTDSTYILMYLNVLRFYCFAIKLPFTDSYVVYGIALVKTTLKLFMNQYTLTLYDIQLILCVGLSALSALAKFDGIH